ncbi:hypothetical protein O6H91_15G081000 [Diphasiastrum complanatum]|uniref:Uncharacterized protein n=2 Tax=Diphasiastrum complanatum TaxID=34168 RepID=A0ACC2BK65_DIPCM|nr:hypothetical protein O6H91_15G025300 [Diphasiastrum complanatum]KAJ7530141.1 hypothetical protein O6H91_15G081000 [Diphasiastrum complanatum]
MALLPSSSLLSSSSSSPFSAAALLSSSAATASPALQLLLHSRFPRSSATSNQKVVLCQSCDTSRAFKTGCESRRTLLYLSAATVAVGFWSSSSTANAADLIQRLQRDEFLTSIRDTLKIAVKENRDLVPHLLRLALNDAATYDKESKSGGPNGSIRFSSELQRPENQGLQAAVKLLEDVKKKIDSESKGGPLSWADLTQLAGQSAAKRTFLDAAIKKCGGDENKGSQVFTAFGSNGQWGFFNKQFGRSESQEPDPEGRVILWEQASVPEIKEKFSKLGLKPRQIAVLSAFLGPSQDAIEAKLATDPEVAPWVEKYQRSRETTSQTDYEVDLIGAFTRLSTLGQTINYEAYTYPPKKVKLKL